MKGTSGTMLCAHSGGASALRKRKRTSFVYPWGRFYYEDGDGEDDTMTAATATNTECLLCAGGSVAT